MQLSRFFISKFLFMRISKMGYLIYLFFLFSTFFLVGEELSFFELPKSLPDEKQTVWKWNKTSVTIRGFCYECDSYSVLSAQPNMKTCCVGSQSKVYEQIFLHDFKAPSSKYVMRFKGNFKIDPVYDQEGKLLQLYHLEEVEELKASFFSS